MTCIYSVDDVMALLLALSASSEELEVVLVSLCFGNIDVESVLRNVVSMFHVLDLERRWRIENGLEPGFTALESCRPIVAIGASNPLEGEALEYDYFHGKDGLHGIHTKVPHFTPSEMWKHLFSPSDPPQSISPVARLPPNFKPSAVPAYKEILNVLRSNPPDTVTIVAVGPLTNLALAAEEDPETFLHAKEVVAMGGSLALEGNVTPVAEFNQYACAYSAARVYALTSPSPVSTMPPCKKMKPYPTNLSRKLNLTAFPLDITTFHLLSLATFDKVTTALGERGSPLAQWMKHFVTVTFEHMQEIYAEKRAQDVEISLHDPLCVWYVLTGHKEGWKFEENKDVRVEAVGQWTRGMSIVDRRSKKKEESLEQPVKEHDRGVWLHSGHGNRVRIAVKSPDMETFGEKMMEQIFKC